MYGYLVPNRVRASWTYPCSRHWQEDGLSTAGLTEIASCQVVGKPPWLRPRNLGRFHLQLGGHLSLCSLEKELAQRGLTHVAMAGHKPLVVLLGEQDPEQAPDRPPVGEDADDGAA